MKKCPYCAEEIQDEAILCRYCGSSLVKSITPTRASQEAEKNIDTNNLPNRPFRVKRDLEHPINNFWYFCIGVFGEFLIGLLFGIIISPFGLLLDNSYIDENFFTVMGLLIFFLAYYIASVIAAKGYDGRLGCLPILLMMVLFIVPIIGQIMFCYYLGKGIYMYITKQNYVERKVHEN